jgi:spartin
LNISVIEPCFSYLLLSSVSSLPFLKYTSRYFLVIKAHDGVGEQCKPPCDQDSTLLLALRSCKPQHQLTLPPAMQDPKLLYAVEGIKAYHIANGVEHSLNPSGPQTLSLLTVPTASGFADPSGIGSGEDDFYLHLHLPPELDLPLPATTQIYHQPPTSYLIPRWDLGPDAGAFTRIEFPPVGSRPGIQEDVDTFETILAQCTAFLERAPPPKLKKSKTTPVSGSSAKAREAAGEELPAYNPADYNRGEGYVQGSLSSSGKGGRIVLVDEEDGSVIGELSDGFQVVEDAAIKPGSKGNLVLPWQCFVPFQEDAY